MIDGIEISLKLDSYNNGEFEELENILQNFKGEKNLYFRLYDDTQDIKIRSRKYNINPSLQLFFKIQTIFEQENVKFIFRR